jgi:transcriptional antiterminator Rof (Rho-off)
MPSARQCVKCLEFLGDVPLVRHYEEQTADGDTVTTAYTDRQIIKTHLTQQDIRQAEEFLEEATEGNTLLYRLDKQEAHLHEAVRQQTVSEFAENFQITDVMCLASEKETNEYIGD